MKSILSLLFSRLNNSNPLISHLSWEGNDPSSGISQLKSSSANSQKDIPSTASSFQRPGCATHKTFLPCKEYTTFCLSWGMSKEESHILNKWITQELWAAAAEGLVPRSVRRNCSTQWRPDWCALDFSKVFHMVFHSLPEKLMQFGLEKWSVQWVRNWLAGHTQGEVVKKLPNQATCHQWDQYRSHTV